MLKQVPVVYHLMVIWHWKLKVYVQCTVCIYMQLHYIYTYTIPFYILVMCCDSSILISFCFTNAKHPGAKAPWFQGWFEHTQAIPRPTKMLPVWLQQLPNVEDYPRHPGSPQANQNSWAEHINGSIPCGRLHVEGKDLRKFKGFCICRGQKQLTREWSNVSNKSISRMDYAWLRFCQSRMYTVYSRPLVLGCWAFRTCRELAVMLIKYVLKAMLAV